MTTPRRLLESAAVGAADHVPGQLGVNWRAALAECSTPVVIALMSATPIKMLLKTDAVMRKLTARMTPSTVSTRALMH